LLSLVNDFLELLVGYEMLTLYENYCAIQFVHTPEI